VYLKNDGEYLIKLYEVTSLLDKNLLAKSFLIGALIPINLTFLINMVMGRIHLREFMSILYNEHWWGEKMEYKILLKEAPYEMHRNLRMWEDAYYDFPKVSMEIYEYYLKEF